MRRILIFSDTHGDVSRCLDIMRQTRADMIIHAGDYVRDVFDIEDAYKNIPIYYVQGNNDIFSRAPAKITLGVDGVRIFITHGHSYGVKYESRYTTLFEAGKGVGADLIVFGHTHIPYTDYREGITILNPGSIRYGGTYAYAEIEKGRLKTSLLQY